MAGKRQIVPVEKAYKLGYRPDTCENATLWHIHQLFLIFKMQ